MGKAIEDRKKRESLKRRFGHDAHDDITTPKYELHGRHLKSADSENHNMELANLENTAVLQTNPLVQLKPITEEKNYASAADNVDEDEEVSPRAAASSVSVAGPAATGKANPYGMEFSNQPDVFKQSVLTISAFNDDEDEGFGFY